MEAKAISRQSSMMTTVASRSTPRGRDFLLEENLVQGRFTLKVDSSRLGGRKQTTQRYYLSTEIH